MNHYKSKLDKEQKKKKELNETMDDLNYVDKASDEAGRKFTVDKLKEEEKKEQNIKDAVASIMQGKSDNVYLSRLAEYGQVKLNELDWPVGWEYYCLATNGADIRIYGKWFSTQIGIQVIVKDVSGNIYLRGVLITMEPEIDMKNVDTLIVQAENTIDSAKGILLSDKREDNTSLKKTKSGIYLPN